MMYLIAGGRVGSRGSYTCSGCCGGCNGERVCRSHKPFDLSDGSKGLRIVREGVLLLCQLESLEERLHLLRGCRGREGGVQQVAVGRKHLFQVCLEPLRGLGLAFALGYLLGTERGCRCGASSSRKSSSVPGTATRAELGLFHRSTEPSNLDAKRHRNRSNILEF